MKRILHFILVCIFIVAGASPVPACYATKPNCQLKGESGCLVAMGSQMTNGCQSASSCPYQRMLQEQQPDQPPFPAERLKRLKVEQVECSPVDLPPITMVVMYCFLLNEQQLTPSGQKLRTEIPFILLSHRPPPLFIQHQAFLI